MNDAGRERFTRECMPEYWQKHNEMWARTVFKPVQKAWLWDAAVALSEQGVPIDLSAYAEAGILNEVERWCREHPE